MTGIAQMYVASADWLKTLFILAPWITIYAVSRVWANVKMHNFLPPDTDPDYLAFRQVKSRERQDEADIHALRG